MNILIDGNDRAKIGDFGLATREMVSKNLAVLNDSDMSSTMTKDIGTALYIAPELLSTAGGTADYTTKIDVYRFAKHFAKLFLLRLLQPSVWNSHEHLLKALPYWAIRRISKCHDFLLTTNSFA